MLLIAGRVIAMAGWLATALIGFHLWKLAGARNPWPRLFFRGIARIIGLRIRVVGAPARGRVMLLANHTSWIDIPTLAAITGTAFVAHDGLADIAALKWLCEMNGTVFVARQDRARVGGQIATLRAALANRRMITVFPEGTTGNGTTPGPFKSALLAALEPLPPDVVVQPVWIDYGALAGEIAWVGAEPGMANVKRILARAAPIDLTIHFLAPLALAALANRKTVANAAHQAIVAAMALQKIGGLA